MSLTGIDYKIFLSYSLCQLFLLKNYLKSPFNNEEVSLSANFLDSFLKEEHLNSVDLALIGFVLYLLV